MNKNTKAIRDLAAYMVDQVIEDILAGVEAKRARYRNYEKTMSDAKARIAHERGFWQQARQVKTEGQK